MSLDPDVKLRLGGDQIASSIGNETAIMSIARGRYYAVGGVAEEIWRMLEVPITPREIGDRLKADYEVTPEQCAAEVYDFLGKLIAEGLVVEER